MTENIDPTEGQLRWRVDLLEAALEQIASPLLEADIDEIREEARMALRMSRNVAKVVR